MAGAAALLPRCSCSSQPTASVPVESAPIAESASGASTSNAPPPSPAPTAAAPKTDTALGVRTIGHCDKAGGTQRFTLAHFNDLQARYGERIKGKSRYAYIAGYLRQLKEQGPTLVLDAGDEYEKGSIAEVKSMGEATRLMVQSLPIDARVIGNHDFAYGEAAVLRDVTLSSHPVLAANLRRGEGDSWPFAPFVRVDVGCVKVGIVGLVTRGYGADDEQDHEPYFGIYQQDDGYLAHLIEQARLHREEVDVMIALTHLGKYVDLELAKAHAGYDFIVGAHSEDLLGDLEAQRERDHAHAYVMQVGHYGRWIGKAEIAVHPDRRVSLEGYRFVSVDESLPVAEDIDQLASQLERLYAPDAQQPIVDVEKEIASGKEMAELVARAAKAQWGVDGVWMGTDVFFDGLPAGPLTLQRLYDAVLEQREPSGTTGFTSLYTVTIAGSELSAARAKLQGAFEILGLPEELDAEKRYRIAIEKRTMSYPTMATGAPPPGLGPSAGRFAGELIDVLEPYARARSKSGKPL